MSNQEAVAAIWSQFDTDGNGYLEKKEADKFVKRLVKETPELQPYEDQIMGLMDSDGDGRLSKEELMAILGG